MKLKKRLKDYLVMRGLWRPTRNGFGFTQTTYDPMVRLRERAFRLISYAQQGEDLVLDRIFTRILKFDPRAKAGFYIDCGAYHPISHSTTYLLYRHGWRGLCIDLSSGSCDLIRRLRPRDYIFNCAIASADSTGAARSIEGISLGNKVQPTSESGIEADELDARSLDSILAEIGFSGRIDYLNIDVEGAEIDCLEGLDFSRNPPRVVSVEIHGRDVHAAMTSDVARYLLDRGYVCVACTVITYFFVSAGDLYD